jgi:hypothetical protein
VIETMIFEWIGYALALAVAYATGRGLAPRGCAHDFHGPRQLVRNAYVRQCEHCGHCEVSNNPIPQPTPERRGAIVNADPSYPRPPAPAAPPPAPAPAPAEYEQRADGQWVRVDRWELGFRNIVTIVVGARATFEIPGIVEKVRERFNDEAPAAPAVTEALRELMGAIESRDAQRLHDAAGRARAALAAAPEVPTDAAPTREGA